MNLPSINDVPMVCELCGVRCRLGDSIPSPNGTSRFGCPVPDCGGFLREEVAR